VIVSDHRGVESLFQELETTTTSPEHRRQLADHVITELVRHSVAEEQYLYPAVREHLPDGDKLAEQELEHHAQAETTMAELENISPASPQFELLLGKLIADVRHHIRGEEDDLLPRLRKALTVEDLRELGEKVLSTKEIAPTRPHPAAADRLPAAQVLHPGSGLVDKVREALTGCR
jgi:hemerythrin superfamily protein